MKAENAQANVPNLLFTRNDQLFNDWQVLFRWWPDHEGPNAHARNLSTSKNLEGALAGNCR